MGLPVGDAGIPGDLAGVWLQRRKGGSSRRVKELKKTESRKSDQGKTNRRGFEPELILIIFRVFAQYGVGPRFRFCPGNCLMHGVRV